MSLTLKSKPSEEETKMEVGTVHLNFKQKLLKMDATPVIVKAVRILLPDEHVQSVTSSAVLFLNKFISHNCCDDLNFLTLADACIVLALEKKGLTTFIDVLRCCAIDPTVQNSRFDELDKMENTVKNSSGFDGNIETPHSYLQKFIETSGKNNMEMRELATTAESLATESILFMEWSQRYNSATIAYTSMKLAAICRGVNLARFVSDHQWKQNNPTTDMESIGEMTLEFSTDRLDTLESYSKLREERVPSELRQPNSSDALPQDDSNQESDTIRYHPYAYADSPMKRLRQKRNVENSPYKDPKRLRRSLISNEECSSTIGKVQNLSKQIKHHAVAQTSSGNDLKSKVVPPMHQRESSEKFIQKRARRIFLVFFPERETKMSQNRDPTTKLILLGANPSHTGPTSSQNLPTFNFAANTMGLQNNLSVIAQMEATNIPAPASSMIPSKESDAKSVQFDFLSGKTGTPNALPIKNTVTNDGVVQKTSTGSLTLRNNNIEKRDVQKRGGQNLRVTIPNDVARKSSTIGIRSQTGIMHNQPTKSAITQSPEKMDIVESSKNLPNFDFTATSVKNQKENTVLPLNPNRMRTAIIPKHCHNTPAPVSSKIAPKEFASKPVQFDFVSGKLGTPAAPPGIHPKPGSMINQKSAVSQNPAPRSFKIAPRESDVQFDFVSGKSRTSTAMPIKITVTNENVPQKSSTAGLTIRNKNIEKRDVQKRGGQDLRVTISDSKMTRDVLARGNKENEEKASVQKFNGNSSSFSSSQRDSRKNKRPDVAIYVPGNRHRK